MILGIGIDSVEIARFAHWHEFSHNRLARIFSPPEIAYCLSDPHKSAQRFAVRFAAREACYKAFSTIIPGVPFLTVCKALSITHNDHRAPTLHIDWRVATRTVSEHVQPRAITPFISLTHSDSQATAIVLLQQ